MLALRTTEASRLARFRGVALRGVPLLDVVLAVVLAVAAAADVADDASLPRPWTAIVTAIWMMSVALRSVAPFAMAVLASLGAVGYAALPVTTTSLAQFVGLLVVAFSTGAGLGGRRLQTALALLLGTTYTLQIALALRHGPDTGFVNVYITPAVLVGIPMVAGRLLRRSREQTARLRQLTAELAEEREAHARAAAAAERNRIARELHDVISHSVSVMVVQAGAAEQQLPADAPAREQLLAVRRTGKEALTDLRRQLGVLREASDAAHPPAPMPGLSDLAQLAKESGADLALDVDNAGDVPAGIALAAYRVVQEALTNARRHAAGARVSVSVGRDREGLALDVVNGPGDPLVDATADGPGHGLVGMRERVDLYAGRVEAGRTPECGWRVHAWLPLPLPLLHAEA